MKMHHVTAILLITCVTLSTATAESVDVATATQSAAPKEFIASGVAGTIPDGWKVLEATPDRHVLVASDGSAQVVVRSTVGSKKLTPKIFADFAKKHLAAAKKESASPVKSIPPSLPEFVYYGGPKSNGRVFAGYVRGVEKTIVVIEAELEAKEPRLAMKFVSDFIQTLKFD